MIVCDNCKKNGVETEIKETGLPNTEVASRGESTLLVIFLANESNDTCDVVDSNAFGEEFEGDWCQACLRAKLQEYLAADSVVRK